MFCFSYLFHSWHPSSHILSQMWSCHFPPVSNFTAGPLLLIIISTLLPLPMSLPLFFRNNKWTGFSLHFLWSFTPCSLFLSSMWWCSHLFLRLIIPRYLQTGMKSCNSSHLDMFHGFFLGSVKAGDLGVCVWSWETAAEKEKQIQWCAVF